MEVERQMADRISFMSFLGFPNPFPDSRTIWLFRERMANTGKDEVVWVELQRQHLTRVLRLDAAETEPGQKRERRAILATSFIKKATSITALFAKLRPPRQKGMIAGLINRLKEMSSYEIEDISACLLEVKTSPWYAGQLMRLWQSLIKKGIG